VKTLGSTRPLHDRPSLVTYAQVAVYGWFIYGFGPSIPLLRDEQGLSSSVAALHDTAFAAATIIVGVFGTRIAHTIGRGRALRYGGILVAIGLSLYCAGHGLAVSLSGAVILGFGAGLLIVFANAHLTAHQGSAAPAALAEANMLAALAGMIAPLALGIGVAIGWGWRPGLLVAALGYVVIEFFRGPTNYFNDDPTLDHDEEPELPLRRPFWFAILALVFLVSAEFCLVFWSSDLLHTRGGVERGMAAASLTAVVAGMAVGRGVGSIFAQRFNPERLLQLVIALAGVGIILAWATTSTTVIVIGLFIAGLGIAMQWPLGMSRAARASDNQSDRAASYAAVAAGIAGGTAPFILGALSDRMGIELAFLVAPAALVIAFAIVTVSPVVSADLEPVVQT